VTYRIVRTTLLLIAALLAGTPQPSEAKGWWDHLEQLSGPGPFSGPPGVAASIVCFKDGRATIKAMDKPTKADPCLYVDYREMSVKAKDPYPEVTAKLTEAGLSFELFSILELGAGMGVARFGTEGVPTTTNFIATPLRIVVKPLRIVPKWRANKNAGFLQVIVKDTVRFGRLTGANFGVAPEVLDVGAETLWSLSTIIDVMQLIRGR
jgi:hypothetical protein